MTEADVSTLTTVPARRYTLIWLAALVGVGFAAIDVAVDALWFNAGTLHEQLLPH